MIRVFDSNEKLFQNNGIKILHPLYASLLKKINSDYYIELEDLIDNLDYYQQGLIIRVDTPFGKQNFRCENPKIKNNRISCKAWHISYDSKNYIVKDSNAINKNCNDAMDYFNMATDITSPITTLSNISSTDSIRMVRKNLEEIWEELAVRYNGYIVRDNYKISILSSIGEDRGVVLAQNKNIIDIDVQEIWDDVVTKILPYTTDGESAILLDNTYVELSESLYDIPYTKVIKFDNELNKDDYATEDSFISATKSWLLTKANNYLNENKLPKVNYAIESNIKNVSDIGDVIYIKHPKCNVNITTQVISIKYDLILEKYVKIEFGNFIPEVKDLTTNILTASNANATSLVKDSTNILENSLNNATSQINAVLGKSYVINEGDKLLVVDSLPKETAKNCILINSAGIAFSQNGINGTFHSAWTIDNTLNMSNINVINLTASLIKGGTLRLGGDENVSGTLELFDDSTNLVARLDKNGITVFANDGSYVILNGEDGFAGYNSQNEKIYWADGSTFHMHDAQVENEIQIAGKIKFVPIDTETNSGIGIVALS